MSEESLSYSVFTKPWSGKSLSELGEFVSGLGFDGVELPVRPGYQVTPGEVERQLPRAADRLKQFGVLIFSVAGPSGLPDERMIAACAEAGVPVIRTMITVGSDGYLATVTGVQRACERLIPLLDKYDVTLGVQNHCGRFVSNAMGLRHLMERFEPRHIAAVWDAAHNALQGEPPDLALDIIWSHLRMVNLKNAFWQRVTGPEAEQALWEPYWTSGRQGLASWPTVAAELKQRGYGGVVCLTAEYSDERAVDRLIAEDLVYARSLFV